MKWHPVMDLEMTKMTKTIPDRCSTDDELDSNFLKDNQGKNLAIMDDLLSFGHRHIIFCKVLHYQCKGITLNLNLRKNTCTNK